jgi:hypothetical protein
MWAQASALQAGSSPNDTELAMKLLNAPCLLLLAPNLTLAQAAPRIRILTSRAGVKNLRKCQPFDTKS